MDNQMNQSEQTASAQGNLAELFARVGHVESVLLKNVYGQTAAALRFAEGLFSAELLSRAEEGRTRPRAAFVFSGPKGVGKAFLAEEAARALGLPFKRFDMSGIADDLQYRSLVGSSSHRFPKMGAMTGFVQQHPECFVIFDGIEKAHRETMEMIHDILDTGVLRDDFLDEEISFRDSYVVFTTRNAYADNVGSLDEWLVEFEELSKDDLERIVNDELAKCCALFERQYGIHAEAEPAVAALLLKQIGEFSGTRKLKKEIDQFFKDEVFKLRGLFDAAPGAEARQPECLKLTAVSGHPADFGQSEADVSEGDRVITVKLIDSMLDR